MIKIPNSGEDEGGNEGCANRFGTYRNHVPRYPRPRPERIDTTFGMYRNHVRNVSQPRSEPILIRSEPTIPLKSRSPDVEASGLIVRRKGVDMLPVASSVKGRKVRIRARVQLPNHYPAPRQVTMVQKQVTEPFPQTVLLH